MEILAHIIVWGFIILIVVGGLSLGYDAQKAISKAAKDDKKDE